MPMVEVDEEQLKLLQRGYGMLDKLFGDPKQGPKVRAAAKELFPEATIRGPEDVAAPFVADVEERIVKPLGEKVDKFAERLEAIDRRFQADDEAKATSTLLADIDAACAKYGLTEEGKEKVINRMKTLNSADAEGAAAVVYGQLPKSGPTGHSGLLPATANLFGVAERSDDKNLELLHTSPDKWQERELNSILGEIAEGTFNAAA